jgi:endonuclease I
LALAAVGAAADLQRAPLGEWSSACDEGFRLAAMPSAWTFYPALEELYVVTHVAIDFNRLAEDLWVYRQNEGCDDGSYELVGYDYMLLEAQVRRAGEITPLATLAGVYTTANGKQPVVFSWDGRDHLGKAVGPGLYEVEVRGRFVPVGSGLAVDDGLGYRDLDGLSGVAEACSRVLRIELSDQLPAGGISRGIICDPPPQSYYSSVDDSNAVALRDTLHPVIDDHTRFPYSSGSTDTWDILNNADEDPSSPSRVLTVYKNEDHADGCSSGCPWDREHTWAKSYGFSEDNSGPGRIPYTDCHHLRAANGTYNGYRSNLPHNTCETGCTEYPTEVNNGFGGGPLDVNKRSGSTVYCGSTPDDNDRWEAWPHRKGDVARIILYMDIRYEGDSGAMGAEQDLVATDTLSLMRVETTACGDGFQDPAYHGVLSTLVEWSNSDPPDSDELRRNQQVWCYQQNRNPFVDHPEWVDCLYNNDCVPGAPAFGGLDSAADRDPCAETGVELAWTVPFDWNDGCSSSCDRGFRVYRSGTLVTAGGCASPLGPAATGCIDGTGAVNTLYTYRVEAFNDLGNATDGGSEVDVGDYTDDGIPPVITDGPEAIPSRQRFTALWDTDEPADSYLEWGTTVGGPYPDHTADADLVTSHVLAATGLSTETYYYYRVCSTDGCGYGPTCSSEAMVRTTGACDPGDDTPIFVNELHYDNVSTDQDEGVEIAGPAATSLAGWSIENYTGSDGSLSTTTFPNPAPLSGIIDDEGTGYGALWFAIQGIQNGAPDGLALIDDSDQVVQFLCWEGTFTATEGAANGMTCTDIGVDEDPAPAIGVSLQLTGGPAFVYEEFTWTGPVTRSYGDLNTAVGQIMECESEDPIFADDFESGDTEGWSYAVEQ